MLTPFLLLAAAIFAADQVLLDSERIGAVLADAAREWTGLEVELGDIDIDLFPVPTAVGEDAWVQGNDFHGHIGKVTLRLNPWPLFRRDIVIERIKGGNIELWLPENPARWVGSIRDIVRTVNEKRTGEGGSFTTSIARIATQDAKVYLGDDPNPHILLTGNTTDVTSPRIGIDVRLDFPEYGEAAFAKGNVTLLSDTGKPLRVRGEAQMREVKLDRLPAIHAPEGVLALDAVFNAEEDASTIVLDGSLQSEINPALTGAGTHRIDWSARENIFSELDWKGAGYEINATARDIGDGIWQIDVPAARFDDEALPGFLTLLDRPQAKLLARSDAAATVRNVDFQISNRGELDLRHGTLEFNGLDLVTADFGPAAEDVRGTVYLENNVLRLDAIESEDITVRGTLAPDFESGSLASDLSAEIELNPADIALITDYDGVTRFQGHLSVEQLKCTYVPGQGVPQDLTIEASLAADEVVVEQSGATYRVRGLEAQFDTDIDGIRTTVQAASTGDTAMALDGTYTFADGVWSGQATTDVDKQLRNALENAEYRDYVLPLADALGPSTFDIRAELPAADRQSLSVHASRRGDMPVSGQVNWSPCAGGYCMDDATAEGTFQSAPVLAAYFPSLPYSEGAATLSFAYAGADSAFEAEAALDNSAIEMSPRVAKPRGVPMRVRLFGSADGDWAVNHIEFQIAEEVVPIRIAETAARMPYDVNLANLQPVLRQGASARGRVTGYVDAGPIVGTATLTETAIQLGDGIGFDRVDGRIEFGNDIVELHDLAVRGARSDCVFNVIYEDNRWDAVARGARFDLDALFELQDSLANLGRAWGVYEPATADSRSLWDDPIVGDATITVDSVHYGRGQLQDVNARIIGDGSSFRVRDLHARPGTGAVTGTIAIVPGDDHDAVVRSAFTWEDVDTAVVDSLFSQADRGVYGTISGELTFDAPMGNVKDMLATGTGTLSWNAREGSLGKLGVATKLLAALKSTEIINLRAPVLRDRGLVYYTFDGSADIVGGRATLGTTMLDGGAYKMVPTGTVNFAEDTTDVTVSVGLLQSVGNVVERVPIVGGVVTGLTTDNVRVAVKLTGSPYDLRASLLGATGKSIVRTPVDIGENVVRGLGRGFRNLVPRGNGNKTRENRATDQNESTPDSE